jgi:hypothetical protein
LEEIEMNASMLVLNLKGRDHLRNLEVDGRIITIKY